MNLNFRTGDNPKIGKYTLLGEYPENYPEILLIGDNPVIRSHSVIYAGCRIGNNFQTGHGVMIRENSIIGDNVSVGTHSVIEKSNNIGNGVRIHSNCFIPEFVVIEDNAWIGPGVTILNTLHPPCPKFSECAPGVVIGRNAKIGGNVTIGPKVTIGADAVIGYGSVVTKPVAPESVVVGNPAKIVKTKKELNCVMGFFERPYCWE